MTTNLERNELLSLLLQPSPSSREILLDHYLLRPTRSTLTSFHRSVRYFTVLDAGVQKESIEIEGVYLSGYVGKQRRKNLQLMKLAISTNSQT